VRQVELERLETRLGRAPRCIDPPGGELRQLGRLEGARCGIAGSEGLGRRSHRRPPSVLFRERPPSVRRRAGRGLAPGVRELQAGDRPLSPQEVDDRAPGVDLRVLPEAAVARADPSARLDRGRLGQDQPGSAARARAEMHEMPRARAPVRTGRVRAHGAHRDPVRQRDAAQPERLEEVRHAAECTSSRPAGEGSGEISGAPRLPPLPRSRGAPRGPAAASAFRPRGRARSRRRRRPPSRTRDRAGSPLRGR